MKILLYIMLYLVIGFVFAIMASKYTTKERGYPIHDFLDLDDDDQSLVIVSFLLWPVILLVASVFAVCKLIVAIANPKEKEDDDAETSEKWGS